MIVWVIVLWVDSVISQQLIQYLVRGDGRDSIGDDSRPPARARSETESASRFAGVSLACRLGVAGVSSIAWWSGSSLQKYSDLREPIPFLRKKRSKEKNDATIGSLLGKNFLGIFKVNKGKTERLEIIGARL